MKRARRAALAFMTIAGTASGSLVAIDAAPARAAAPPTVVTRTAAGAVTITAGETTNQLVVVAGPTDVRVGNATAPVQVAGGAIGCGPDGAQVVCATPTSLVAIGSTFDDVMLAFGTIGVTFEGRAGNDTLTGGDGNDTLNGQNGDDTVSGRKGNDTVLGMFGDDTLDGGAGPSTGPDTDLVDGGPGTDTVLYKLRPTWPTVTADGVANDGESGENDNAVGYEHAVLRPYNFDADLAVLPRGASIPVARVWAGANYQFSLQTRNDVQAVGYYDATGALAVSARRVGSTQWFTKRLPTLVLRPFDNHRSIEMTFDAQGYLHLAGNMHGDPLQYYRTTMPLDVPERVSTLTQRTMFGDATDDSSTYPAFFTTPDGRLLFTYRDGYSNGGDMWVNEYDLTTKSWRHTTGDVPVFAGVFGRESYLDERGQLVGDISGIYWTVHLRNGVYHVVGSLKWWNPRECYPKFHHGSIYGGDLSCNLFYFTTTDWEHFANAAGEALSLPMTPESLRRHARVDSGEIGGRTLAFTDDGRPMILYVEMSNLVYDAASGWSVRLTPTVAVLDRGKFRTKRLVGWRSQVPLSATEGVSLRFAGPRPDANGVSRWYLNASLTVNGDQVEATGWREFDPARRKVSATTVPTPANPNPCSTGNNGSWAVFDPVEFPNYVQPWTERRFSPFVIRNDFSFMPNPGENLPPYDPDTNDAGDYYYLRWEGILPLGWGLNDADGQPAELYDLPATQLTLHRTTCRKT